jgi:hypothetical protein
MMILTTMMLVKVIILAKQLIEAEYPASAPPIEGGMGNFDEDDDDDSLLCIFSNPSVSSGKFTM